MNSHIEKMQEKPRDTIADIAKLSPAKSLVALTATLANKSRGIADLLKGKTLEDKNREIAKTADEAIAKRYRLVQSMAV